ncbi:MAG: hypothetical protein A2V88_06765 [Elusimicrobia bacterium RBG_16_66_12]|nr:MAG: hypothetical protein A2V88_06765 [Elusimicrobia bacterium RBG_16_66_12]
MNPKKAPHPWPAPDWTPVRPFPFSEARKAFAGLTSQEGLLVLRYFRRPDGVLVAATQFGPLAEGTPGLVHGGAILTALDEALGAAAWVAGIPSVTVRLETAFRVGVPLDAKLLLETRVLSTRGRLALVEGDLLGPDGTIYAQAKGRFMRLDETTQRRLYGRAV